MLGLNSRGDEFWTRTPEYVPDPKYGLFHVARRDGLQYCAGTLLVLIHGIRSDPRRCWGELPQALCLESRDRRNIDLDIFSYGYNSRQSIDNAAAPLYSVLTTLLPRYHTLLFVCHSAGGLIIKQLAILANSDPTEGSRLLERTHAIVNFAVPHAGARSGLAAMLWRVALKLRAISRRLLPALRPNTKTILDDLAPGSTKLVRLERDFSRVVSRRCRPALGDNIFEFEGDSDLVASAYRDLPRFGRVQRRVRVLLRGGHTSVIDAKDNIAVAALVAKLGLRGLLDDIRRKTGFLVARASSERLNRVQEDNGVLYLAGDDEGESSQKAVYEALRNHIVGDPPEPQRILVTGALGVGKSVVLRHLAHELAEEFLNDDSGELPLPIFIPLGRLDAARMGGGGASVPRMMRKRSTGGLLAEWFWWARDCIADLAMEHEHSELAGAMVNHGWYWDRLSSKSTVLVIDGVDDFLNRYDSFDIRWIEEALENLTTVVRGRKLWIITGVRNTQFRLERLLQDARGHYEVKALSVDAAERFEPSIDAKDLYQRLQSEEARRIVFTPLILRDLAHAMNSGRVSLGSPAEILRAALEGHLGWHGVQEKRRFVVALTALAWRFYELNRSTLSREELLEGMAQDRDDWASHVGLGGSGVEYLEGYNLVGDLESWNSIVTKTVLMRTAGDTVGFKHDEWRTFLVANYLAEGIRNQHVDVLARRAFTGRHYALAAQLLSNYNYTIEAPLVERVLKTRDRFAIGNFVAIVGYWRTKISFLAVETLFGALNRIDPLARHVALARLGVRALLGDSLRPALLKGLTDVLPGCLASDGAAADGPAIDVPVVTASLAWCYQRALRNVLNQGEEVGGQSEVRPRLRKEHVDEALRMVCGKPGMEPSEQYRSLHKGFLYAVVEIPGGELGVVAAVHYLYIMTAAYVGGACEWEVAETLHDVLSAESRIVKLARCYDARFEVSAGDGETVGKAVEDIVAVCRDIAGVGM